MEFNELGFSSENTSYESSAFSIFLNTQLNGTITHPQISVIPWDMFFMTDRQCAKKILIKREPELTDDDVNKMVFGNDLKRQQGASYVEYVTDNEVIDPSIVSTDESMSDTLDSPFKPIKPTVELYEQIYQWKKILRFDFMIIEKGLIDLSDDRQHIKFLIDKASSFINTSALTQKPTTTPLPATNLTMFVTSPLNVNVASLFAIIMESLKIARDNKRRIISMSKNFENMIYLDFLIKPEKISSIYTTVIGFTTNILEEKDRYNKIEDLLKNKQKLVEDAQTKLQNFDSVLENTTINQFITPVTGAIAAEVAYEALRQQTELDKEQLLRDLVNDLKLSGDEINLFS